MITFHEAAFGIIDGYYYSDGRNETINHAIEDLYNSRLKLKNENPTHMVIKLLMNPMYGKTIINQLKQILLLKIIEMIFGNICHITITT